MKIQKIVTVLGVAASTMALVLALVGPRRVEAVDNDAAVGAIKPVINQPTFELAGLNITLSMDKTEYASGDEPVVMLEATNPTDRPVKTKLWLGMTSTSVASRMSRIMVMPEYVWSESCDLALEPGARQTIELKTGQKLAADQTISVTMSDKDQKAAMSKLINIQQLETPQIRLPDPDEG